MKNRYDIKSNTCYESSRVRHFYWAAIAVIIVLTFLTAIFSEAKAATQEESCLSQIMWAEAQGESIAGIGAVAEAAVKRAKSTGKTVCTVKGVKRKPVPSSIKPHVVLLAKQAISGKHSILKKSDSWNTGKIPRQPGEIEKVIGKHVFYKESK